jgi:rhodanese-related sulfurtransferase
MAEDAPAQITPAELAQRLEAGEVQVVDVRTDDEWAEGRIAGSRHVVLNDLTGQADSLDRSQPVVFVCSGGNRSAMAAEAFRTAGFEARSLEGGLKAWAEQGNELEND